MQTYTITRNGETIGKVYSDSRKGAAMAFASRIAKRIAVVEPLADGTWQALIRRPKLARFEPVGQPFSVEK